MPSAPPYTRQSLDRKAAVMTMLTIQPHSGASSNFVPKWGLIGLGIATLAALAFAGTQGREGWIGAGLALALGCAFFAVDTVLLLPVMRAGHAYFTVALGLTLYSFKTLGLLVFLVNFWDADWFDAAAFGWTLLVVTLWWQVRLMNAHHRARILLYDLAPSPVENPLPMAGREITSRPSGGVLFGPIRRSRAAGRISSQSRTTEHPDRPTIEEGP